MPYVLRKVLAAQYLAIIDRPSTPGAEPRDVPTTSLAHALTYDTAVNATTDLMLLPTKILASYRVEFVDQAEITASKTQTDWTITRFRGFPASDSYVQLDKSTFEGVGAFNSHKGVPGVSWLAIDHKVDFCEKCPFHVVYYKAAIGDLADYYSHITIPTRPAAEPLGATPTLFFTPYRAEATVFRMPELILLLREHIRDTYSQTVLDVTDGIVAVAKKKTLDISNKVRHIIRDDVGADTAKEQSNE